MIINTGHITVNGGKYTMGEFSTIFSGGTVQFNSGTVSGTTGFDEVDLTLAGGSIQGCKTGIKWDDLNYRFCGFGCY